MHLRQKMDETKFNAVPWSKIEENIGKIALEHQLLYY